MPSDWEETTLGEIAQLEYGKALKASERTGSGCPVYGSSGVVGLHEAALVPDPTIIIGRKGNAGAVYLTRGPSSPIDTVYWVRLKNPDVIMNWLGLWCENHDLAGLGQKGARPGLSRDIVHEQELLVPPVPEQLRIADLMGAVDGQIAAYEAQIQACRRRRTALLTDLLKPQEGWEESTLGEVADTKSGSTPKAGSAEYWEGGDTPFLKIGDLNDGPVVEAHDYVTEKAVKDYRLKTYEPETLLFAMYGASIGKLGLLKFPATANQAILAITPKSDVLDVRFLFNVLLTDRDRLVNAGFGAAQKNLSGEFMKEWEIPCPPLSEQLRIAEVMSAVDDELAALCDARTQTQTLRTALLQDLLSGAHRIPESYDRLLKTKIAADGSRASAEQRSAQAAD